MQTLKIPGSSLMGRAPIEISFRAKQQEEDVLVVCSLISVGEIKMVPLSHPSIREVTDDCSQGR